MRKWAFALVFVGLCTIAYPHVQQAHEDKQQRELLASLQEYSALIGTEDAAADTEEASLSLLPGQGDEQVEPADGAAGPAAVPETSGEAAASPRQEAVAVEQPPTPKATAKPKTAVKPAAMGIIEIPKIASKLPLLAGVTDANMKLGAVHFKGTAVPGQQGNAVIAAHRSLNYGRLFNRLVELEKGDTVVVTMGGEKKSFEVTATEIVEPDEISVLKQPRKGTYLTLITCDPIDTGTHRFIVHAKAVEIS
ncbi:sortase A [Paenibacillus sp. UNCCL117]|uniref:class D sortase n=1 Tax=unclassified Paenibacillus TaxID=185978 RepID=UPI00087ED8CC|nr:MULTISPECIES: class D sortase [unclassified Paenibacillus]SDD02315.1 sortase A [Paenibacillus sp. cl123]SFW32512.1 sortase A [Paenibacillus sp. UNCCL117]